MTASPLTVFSLCAVGLLGMSSLSLLILRAQARRDQLGARIARTVGPYQPSAATALATGSSVGLAVQARGLDLMLTWLFGFDLQRQDHYMLRWWVALIVTAVGAALTTKLASGLTGNLVWIGMPAVWIGLSRGFFNWCEGRRRDKLLRQFPDALAMIVRAVRVGVPVTDAVRAVGRELAPPTGPEFTRLSDELAIGIGLEDALKVMAERNALQEYRFFATALSLQSQTGGGLSETLDNLAEVIRKRLAVRLKGAALSAEAKMSSIVLASLPPLAAAGLWIMNGAYIAMLFTDPLGQKILAMAILTLGFGIVAMRFLIHKSLS